MTDSNKFDETTERGVHNPRVIDLISREEETVVLGIFEFRPWGTTPDQLDEMETKFNNYLDYVFDGYLIQQYPQYHGLKVTIRILSKEPPTGPVTELFQAMSRYLSSINTGFESGVLESAPH